MDRMGELGAGSAFRVGLGYDIHRLARPEDGGRELVVGGEVLSGAERGPVARSDGDVLLHALTDALLGAIGGPDIGDLFPDTDEANEGRDSSEFVREAVRRVRAAGYGVVNADCVVILERPKLGGMKVRIAERVAGLLGVEIGCVCVKGKTHEGVDSSGRGESVESHVVVMICRP